MTANFKNATITFILIMLFINFIQFAFGSENVVIGLIFAPLILILMSRDLTARPVKHLFRQALLLGVMAIAASLTATVHPVAALLINFIMTFGILYTHTYECGEHLYFQYILSYLFLIFISPVPPAHLPKRLLAIAFGSVCVILYQWIKGKDRIVKTTQEVFTAMLDEAENCTKCLIDGKHPMPDQSQIHTLLDKLSRMIDHRRKKTLCISNASFALIEAGQNLQYLILILSNTPAPSMPNDIALFHHVSAALKNFRAYILQEETEIPPLDIADFGTSEIIASEQLYQILSRIQKSMSALQQVEKIRIFSKTSLPISSRLKAIINVSPIRIAYALRVSCTLAISILLVQHFNLTHGKWLLFTIASVSLPYADEVGTKAKNRMLATLLGGILSIVAFTLIPSPSGRTAVMMLSGYLSFYMPDYLRNFTCSTIGALGGAVLMDTTGMGFVSSMVLIRLAYILLGILISLAINNLIFPFSLKKATHQLGQKYISVTEKIARLRYDGSSDPQLYYNLLVYLHQLENKICRNAELLHWDGVDDFLARHKKTLLSSDLS